MFIDKDKINPEIHIRSDIAENKGFIFNDNQKAKLKTEVCKFCENTLYYYYLKNTIFKDGFKLLMVSYIEKCNCEKAKKYWEKKEVKENAEKEAKERYEANMAMKRKVDKIFSESGIESRFKQRTFDTFEVNDINKKAYETTKLYADKFVDEILTRNSQKEKSRNSLFITGSFGTGKTHLACAIANQLMVNQIPVICMTMIKLLDRIKKSFNQNLYDDVTEYDILKTYTEVPLLIIDDLGSEHITEWSMSKIFSIINSRYEANKPIIITTNYGSNELVKRLTPIQIQDEMTAAKTLDRLKEISVGVEMNWESYRIKRN